MELPPAVNTTSLDVQQLQDLAMQLGLGGAIGMITGVAFKVKKLCFVDFLDCYFSTLPGKSCSLWGSSSSRFRRFSSLDLLMFVGTRSLRVLCLSSTLIAMGEMTI